MKILYIPFILILCSCSPLIKKTIADSSAKPLSDSAEVALVTVEQPTPDSCKLIGNLHYGEGGLSPSWGYNKLIQESEKEARKMGGNVIKINELEAPEEGYSNSYTLYLSVYYRQNLSNIPNRLKAIADSLHKLKFPESPPTYAILYVYRPPGLGALIGYDIELYDNIVLCRAKNNSFYEIKLRKEGKMKLTGTTESTSSVTIDVKFGEEYYLKCTMHMGVVVGEPDLRIVPNWQGSIEYEQLKNTKK